MTLVGVHAHLTQYMYILKIKSIIYFCVSDCYNEISRVWLCIFECL